MSVGKDKKIEMKPGELDLFRVGPKATRRLSSAH